MPSTTIADWYQPVDTITEGRRKDTLTAPADHPHGEYQAGDEVSPFDMTRAHLRAIATGRTSSGRISAAAQVAAAELARNKANRTAKREVNTLVQDALKAAGLL